MTDESDEELKGKTWEEKLAILERSDESDLEIIRRNKEIHGLFHFNDAQWKLGVGMIGAAIAIILVMITLRMVEALLSGSF